MKEPFLAALKQEIAETRDYLSGEPVHTIYFGGGTPSVYEPQVLQEIMEWAATTSPLDPEWSKTTSPPDLSWAATTSPPDPSPEGEGSEVSGIGREITIELNPEDVTEAYVAALKSTWFNRFSLGVQSFSDNDLVSLNRSHSAMQAVRAVKLLQGAGYDNISIDLIYGIPSSPPARWLENLDTAFSLGVPHISAYALTVEPKTPLAWMISHQKSAPVSDEMQVNQFSVLMEQTKKNGFLQYEISNFCKPGRHAVHNTSYWNGIPYLGLGPSAHSFNGTSRRWNIANLSHYIDGMQKGVPRFEEELLSPAQKYNEYVMTSLRTMWGCSGDKVRSDFGFAAYKMFRQAALPMISKELLVETSGVYFLTEEGKLFADQVASDLFMV